MLKIGKRVFYLLWGVIMVYLLVLYVQNPEIIRPEYIRNFVSSYGAEMLWIYAAISIIRGFFLIPSTPFVIGGILLFPDQLLLVLLISMLGVIFSATALYYFADAMGFSQYLECKYSKKVEKWKTRLTDPKAALFVFAWSLFPLVPTDLICYVAGLVKMPYPYMFAGVFGGELLLNVCYIYLGFSL